MTEIREAAFGVDLPGQWRQVPSEEAGTFAYEESDGAARLAVTLLSVKPMYAIADPGRLLDDYLHHRSSFEAGRDAALAHTEPVRIPDAEGFEGGWDAFDLAEARRLRHRTIMVDGLLADFCYETFGLDEAAFDELAQQVLGSVTVVTE